MDCQRHDTPSILNAGGAQYYLDLTPPHGTFPRKQDAHGHSRASQPRGTSPKCLMSSNLLQQPLHHDPLHIHPGAQGANRVPRVQNSSSSSEVETRNMRFLKQVTPRQQSNRLRRSARQRNTTGTGNCSCTAERPRKSRKHIRRHR